MNGMVSRRTLVFVPPDVLHAMMESGCARVRMDYIGSNRDYELEALEDEDGDESVMPVPYACAAQANVALPEDDPFADWKGYFSDQEGGDRDDAHEVLLRNIGALSRGR